MSEQEQKLHRNWCHSWGQVKIALVTANLSGPVPTRLQDVPEQAGAAYRTGGIRMPRLAGRIIPDVSTRRMPSLFWAEGTIPSVGRYPKARPKLNFLDPSHTLQEQTL